MRVLAMMVGSGMLSGCAAYGSMMAAEQPVAVEPIPTTGEAMAMAEASDWIRPDPEQTLYIETTYGRIVVLLADTVAAGHVAQVKTLAREGYYDGLHFYRVIDGFVAQGGDESGERSKGTAKDSLAAEFEEPFNAAWDWRDHPHADGYTTRPGYLGPFPAGRDEKTGTVWLAHCTGAFAFGRENGRDTASTEFYITLQPQRYLDRNLTVTGRVLVGMEVAQRLPRAAFGNFGVIADKDDWTVIETVRLAADVPEAERSNVEVLNTQSEAFSALLRARADRTEEFFHFQHSHVDMCQMSMPVRYVPDEAAE